jgi:hypothetical protein
MSAFQRSLDNYLMGNDYEREYDLCLDGHEWSKILVDSNGAYKMCLVCDWEGKA